MNRRQLMLILGNRSTHRHWIRSGLICLVALASTGLMSCSLVKLSEDVRSTEDYGLLYGRVETPSCTLDNVIVLLYEEGETGTTLDEVDRLGHAIDRYAFPARFQKRYWIVAFQDLDGNLRRGPEEPVGMLDDGPISVRPREKVELDPFRLEPNTVLPDEFPIDLRGHDLVALDTMPLVAGELTSLSAERFSREVAKDGLWQPMTTALEYGAGVYLLEPYDPDRIPVLFVHGVGGTPTDFTYLIDNLDRERFQAWVYHYPSGARLYSLAAVLKGLIRGLHEDLGFDTLFVTAHSMGGLVARSFILQAAADGTADFIKLYISFSTPYNGHEGAAKGVEHLPVVVPCWIDMQPDSPFLMSIREPLPEHIPFYLFFGHDAKGFKPGMNYSSDSVISLRSQLALFAQAEAVRTWGYDLAHVPILHSPLPLNRYSTILEMRAEELE